MHKKQGLNPKNSNAKTPINPMEYIAINDTANSFELYKIFTKNNIKKLQIKK
jgi:hypothetical protein